MSEQPKEPAATGDEYALCIEFLRNRAEECALDGYGWESAIPHYKACADAIERLSRQKREDDERIHQLCATLRAIEPRCEYVGCEQPGPHITHSVGGTATATYNEESPDAR